MWQQATNGFDFFLIEDLNDNIIKHSCNSKLHAGTKWDIIWIKFHFASLFLNWKKKSSELPRELTNPPIVEVNNPADKQLLMGVLYKK